MQPSKSDTGIKLSELIDYQSAHAVIEDLIAKGPKELRELARFRLVELELRFILTHAGAIAALIEEKGAGVAAAIRAAGGME